MNFGLLRVPVESFHFAGKVRQNVFSLGRELREGVEIGQIAREPVIEFDIFFQSPPGLQYLLGLLLASPELRLRYFLLELDNLRALLFGIKDTLGSV